MKAINYPVVFRILGWLVLIEGLFMLAPLATCLIYCEADWKAFAIASCACLCVGLLMARCIKPRRHDMAKREGFLLTAMVWVILSAFGMIPFMTSQHPLSLSDAYFEAMSGFTTTGASVMTSIEHLSHGILLWRAMMNWIGGMGIILFTLAVIPMLNHSGGMQMFNAEVTGITHEKLRPRVSQTAKNLWMVYLSMSLLLFILLCIGPMGIFDSICHAMSTISTGGFSTRDASIGAWNSIYIDVVVTIFMLFGGINFALIWSAIHGKWKQVIHNDVLQTLFGVILVFYILFVIAIISAGQYTGWRSITIDPIFLIVSSITSTGLTVNNFENWGSFALSMLFFMMFFGACAGSTSGGAKIDRLIFLAKNLNNEIYRTVHPNSILAVRVNGKVMSQELVSKVIAFLCLYVLVIVIGGAVLTIFGLPLVDAFFSAFSCIGNTGLGAGVTGLGGGYDLLPDPAKWVLSLIMLTGRLEVFTILILFTPGFWRR